MIKELELMYDEKIAQFISFSVNLRYLDIC